MRVLREWLNRLRGSVQRGRSDEDLEAELRSHLEMANDRERAGVDATGRTARLKLGNSAQAMNALRDQRGWPRIDALSDDVVFGWRQLMKHRGVTVAAVMSLGLAVGAATAAFRLVDAVLLRPMPVADPNGLFLLATTFADADFRPDYNDSSFDYPIFRKYRDAIGDRGDVMLLGSAARGDARIGSAVDPETIFRQYVSGNVFPSFGLRPALGRLIGQNDDAVPGANPVAVITDAYWTRRFGRRADVIGEKIRIGSKSFEIIGVAPKDFVGTEPGRLTDVFVPATMNTAALDSPGWSWFRIWIRPKNGASRKEIEGVLQPSFAAEHAAQAARLPPETPRARVAAYLEEGITLLPAASGASGVKKEYRRPLLILMVLVTLVLLVACANVANLLIGQALTRAREMALRLSIGAGRGRLVQLVLIEGLLLALLATVAGALIAAWSAPLVVAMLAPPDDPVRLVMHADLRTLGFGALLTLTVTVLFGLAPALRASAVKPVLALRGGDDSRGHWRLTHSLIALQMTFSVAVLFVAWLFVTTFQSLTHRPLGFADRGLVILDTDGQTDLSVETWAHVADTLRNTPGVDAATVASWTPLSGNSWAGRVVVEGRTPPAVSPYFLSVGPSYFETMGIPLREGRDFRAGDIQPGTKDKRPVPGVGIVSESFARVYFDGRNPVGQHASVSGATMEIIGVVGDAVYRNMRERIRPQVYVPLEPRSNAAILFRTTGDPARFGADLSRQVLGMPMGLRAEPKEMSALVREQLIRERLLAILSMFFAGVAVLLAGVGLYGVLNHAVIRQRREIGIRLALGAGAARIIGQLTGRLFLVISLGAAAGLAAGISGGRFVEGLLFGVTRTDPWATLIPIGALFGAAALAAVPAALRATRVNPSAALRGE